MAVVVRRHPPLLVVVRTHGGRAVRPRAPPPRLLHRSRFDQKCAQRQESFRTFGVTRVPADPPMRTFGVTRAESRSDRLTLGFLLAHNETRAANATAPIGGQHHPCTGDDGNLARVPHRFRGARRRTAPAHVRGGRAGPPASRPSLDGAGTPLLQSIWDSLRGRRCLGYRPLFRARPPLAAIHGVLWGHLRPPLLG